MRNIGGEGVFDYLRQAIPGGKSENFRFASMFLISVGAIIIQLLLTVNLRFVLGETLIALLSGIVYAFIMVHNDIWDKGLSEKNGAGEKGNENYLKIWMHP